MKRGGDPAGDADDCHPDDAALLSKGDRYVGANALKVAHPGTYALVSIRMNDSTC